MQDCPQVENILCENLTCAVPLTAVSLMNASASPSQGIYVPKGIYIMKDYAL